MAVYCAANFRLKTLEDRVEIRYQVYFFAIVRKQPYHGRRDIVAREIKRKPPIPQEA